MSACAYDLIKREYLSGHWRDRTPAKLSLSTLLHENGLPAAFTNLMAAQLSNGYLGAKVVSVNELTGRMDGKVMLFRPSGELVATLSADHVTRMRCAYMAMLAIEQFYRSRPSLANLKIGFIGTGAINTQTAIEIQRRLNIRPYMAKGSPRNPYKNRSEPPWHYTRFVTDLADLAQCDVLISCTNAHDPAETIEVKDFDGIEPRLVIAQDTGWLLGHSWRFQYDLFADDPLQLDAHRFDEFPHDPTAPRFEADDWLGDELFEVSDYEDMSEPGAVAYLYGTAISDAAFAMATCCSSPMVQELLL